MQTYEDMLTEYNGNHKQLIEMKKDYTRTLVSVEERIQDGVKQVDQAVEQRNQELARFSKVVKATAALAIVLTLLIMGLAGHIMLETTKSLASISEKIRSTTDHAHSTSEHLQKTATTVSQSATNQASAVAESVATLSEIEAMVSQSVQHAKNSADQAKISHSLATEGQQVMVQLRQSMKSIESSIGTISDEAKTNTERMSSIVRIFDLINQKTAVINDIVFHTKLLSFSTCRGTWSGLCRGCRRGRESRQNERNRGQGNSFPD
ncbi:MAG TPA: methyl-accepting chemotaxis protein [Oligoflexus sp.]|uniref:methyl-accepting chemotaxis protein n=1 Tax=Oligoflexus sp. TaxID=1971216 RepID=UPI002D4C31FE|nr:methyl-accepting chemotaxis protein [Oligoflexus sp.]HYX36923.1 methyl-accepting chemotaxis protein [Oligoflexus sp.]